MLKFSTGLRDAVFAFLNLEEFLGPQGLKMPPDGME